jgi:hypothetical protein
MVASTIRFASPRIRLRCAPVGYNAIISADAPEWRHTLRLPHAERSEVSKAKMTDYLLNFAHEIGRHKAEFFTQFGFTADAWEALAGALRVHAESNDVCGQRSTRVGIVYVVEGPLGCPDGRSPRVRSVWHLNDASEGPQFVTAYPARRRAASGAGAEEHNDQGA